MSSAGEFGSVKGEMIDQFVWFLQFRELKGASGILTFVVIEAQKADDNQQDRLRWRWGTSDHGDFVAPRPSIDTLSTNSIA